MKNVEVAQRTAAADACPPLDVRTRDRVTELLLQQGSATATELGLALGLSAAGIRRHLDAMLAEGLVESRSAPTAGAGAGDGPRGCSR